MTGGLPAAPTGVGAAAYRRCRQLPAGYADKSALASMPGSPTIAFGIDRPGGATIPASAPVASVLSSARRDETRYKDPDRFNIHRSETGHAAYGFGSHFCAGRWFAQRLIPHLLRPLLERLPDLKLEPDRPPVFRGWEFRAPSTLHVTYGRN
jgi:hypothetical protein